MKIKNGKIISRRFTDEATYWQTVYEWEDIFAEELDLEINKSCNRIHPAKKDLFTRIVRKLFRIIYERRSFTYANLLNLAFIMVPEESWYYKLDHVIPIYLDVDSWKIDKIKRDTRKLPLFFVTSKKIHEMINQDNCFFIPLSVSDKYYDKKWALSKRDIDVVYTGRRNKLLHSYMLDYCKSHPNCNYVYIGKSDDEGNAVYVSVNGDVYGSFRERSDYIGLLRNSKISLVSVHDSDTVREDQENDFFTPRFYESAVCYCHMIGCYVENMEAGIIGIKDICHNVKSYDSFAEQIDRFLVTDNKVNAERYDSFIKSNLTSKRTLQIKKIYENRMG